MALGLDKVARRKKLTRVSEVIEEVDVRLTSWMNVEPSVSLLLKTFRVNPQLEKDAIPSKLSGETLLETYIFSEEIPVDIDRELWEKIPVTMDPGVGGGVPPPIPPIDPLVRPKGLPFVIPQSLVAVDIPSHIPRFYGTKDEGPSRHIERFVERVASSLITNQVYWLVRLHTTLKGEAYEWYKDYVEGHFRVWKQLQKEILNKIRPKVGQNMALRALINVRQGKEEEISGYIRRFSMVCARYVGPFLMMTH